MGDCFFVLRDLIRKETAVSITKHQLALQEEMLKKTSRISVIQRSHSLFSIPPVLKETFQVRASGTVKRFLL